MAKMIIVRGKEYNVKFIVKQAGASVPMVLDPLDTAEIYINKKDIDNTLLINKTLTQGDPDLGEFILELTPEETALLPFENKFAEDGSRWASTCRGHISTVTVESGNGEILIPDIYVADVGL